MIIIGYCKGFVYALVNFAYTALCIAIAWFLSPVFANSYPIIKLEDVYEDAKLLTKLININPLINMIIYFVIIFLVLKLFYLFLAIVLKGLNKIPVIGKFNQILGAFAGIFNATLITIALSILLSLPIFRNGKEVKEKTMFKIVNSYTTKVINYVVDNFDLNKFKVKIDDFDIDSARDDFKNWLNSING